MTNEFQNCCALLDEEFAVAAPDSVATGYLIDAGDDIEAYERWADPSWEGEYQDEAKKRKSIPA
jgi:hypothetical protein